MKCQNYLFFRDANLYEIIRDSDIRSIVSYPYFVLFYIDVDDTSEHPMVFVPTD